MPIWLEKKCAKKIVFYGAGESNFYQTMTNQFHPENAQ